MQKTLTYFISSFNIITSAAFYLTSCGTDNKIHNTNPPEIDYSFDFQYLFTNFYPK